MNKTYFKLLVLMISSLFVITSFTSCNKSSGTDLKWHGFERAVRLAQKENKPIMVDFYADWCSWCYELDARTFNDPEVKEYLKENFILARLNADHRFKTIRYRGELFSPHDLLMSSGSRSLPTVVFLDSNANFVHTQPGFQNAEFYLRLLQTVKEAIEKVQADRENQENQGQEQDLFNF